MASKVDVWNAALSHLGHKANIADPDEQTAEANHCRRFYPMALGVTLERYAWRFATRREVLVSVDIDTDLSAWSFGYALPNLCVAPRAVILPGGDEEIDAQPFTVEIDEDGDTILYTNAEDAILKYTKYVDDTVKFTPNFVMAVSADLASLLVGPIPKDPKKRQEMQQLAIYYTSLAQAADANASRSDRYATFTPAHLAARS